MERRRQYRVDFKELKKADTTVSIVPERGGAMEGRLIDSSAGGAAVLLPDSLSKKLRTKDRVTLKFNLHVLGKPLRVPASVGFLQREKRGTRVGFRFKDAAALEQALTPELFALFNRRDMFRVRPDLRDPIWAKLSCSEGAETEVLISDVSGGGVGIYLKEERVGPFASADKITLTFNLPKDPQTIVLDGNICYRLQLGDRWRLGIQFDPRSPQGFARLQQRIISYVMRRQREQLNIALRRQRRMAGR